MPILIEWKNFKGAPSQSGPIFVCDHCDEQIDDVADGNAQWREPSASPGRGRRELYFTHKRCYRAFTADQTPTAPFMWNSEELAAFLWFLESNTGFDVDAGKDLARSAAGVGS
jgi:hypothetical protein